MIFLELQLANEAQHFIYVCFLSLRSARAAPRRSQLFPSSVTMMHALFTPIQVGRIKLQHRIAMAPMGRCRAHESHVHSGQSPPLPTRPKCHRHASQSHSCFAFPKPTPTLDSPELATTYYSQRASTPGTLIISEATFISAASTGFAHCAGIYTAPQVAAWKYIVSGVHSNSSFIFLQLWAMGRPADPVELARNNNGVGDVVSASNVPLEGHPIPRALTIPEIRQYQKDYALAAKRFVDEAGGDGVEVHAANEYLPDQFLRENTNLREDVYGGGVEGRIRFLVELVDELVEAVGAERVGVKVSPYGRVQGMSFRGLWGKGSTRADFHSGPGMEFSLAATKETFSVLAKTLKSRHPNLAVSLYFLR